MAKKIKKILIDGNSVVSRVCPQDGDSYLKLLDNLSNTSVINISKGHRLIGESSRSIDSFLVHEPDFIILNFGINELCSRSIPLSLYKYLYLNVKRTYIGYFFEGLAKYFESNLRPILVNIRFRRSWYRIKQFELAYEELINNILKYSAAKIICLTINLPSKRVEKQLPGSYNRVKKWNALLTEKYGNSQRIFIIRTDEFNENLTPDGVHFNSKGHHKLCSRLQEIIGF